MAKKTPKHGKDRKAQMPVENHKPYPTLKRTLEDDWEDDAEDLEEKNAKTNFIQSSSDWDDDDDEYDDILEKVSALAREVQVKAGVLRQIRDLLSDYDFD